jgi:hypothetical protein
VLIELRECKATTRTDYKPNLLGDMPTKYIDFGSSVALGLFSFSSQNTLQQFSQRRCFTHVFGVLS